MSLEELGRLLEWLFLAEQRRTASAPPGGRRAGLLQRVSAAVRRAVDSWRGLRGRKLGAWHPARRG